MKRRRYTLGKRADAAGATRRRIVEATMHVHDEQGITNTSVRDVAARAGVSPATVLNHFPRMSDLIDACGQLTNELFPMPTPAVLNGAHDSVDAVRRAAVAMFEWWEAVGPGWDHLQIDRRTLSDVDAWLIDVERQHRALVAAAGADLDETELVALVALTTRGAWRSFRASGLDSAAAAVVVARVISGPAHARNPPTRRH